jgi:hypothetical protein
MARNPKTPYGEPSRRHEPETKSVITPERRFTDKSTVRVVTDRTPRSVTKIRPEDMETILPEMIYIPPA